MEKSFLGVFSQVLPGAYRPKKWSDQSSRILRVINGIGSDRASKKPSFGYARDVSSVYIIVTFEIITWRGFSGKFTALS